MVKQIAVNGLTFLEMAEYGLKWLDLATEGLFCPSRPRDSETMLH